MNLILPWLNRETYRFIWIAVGAARLRNVFRTARANKPALILIDDIDAFARSRSVGSPSEGELELNFTLLQLMKEMDDRHNAGVILLATTNRMDLLDPALLQPNRFDRVLEVGVPDEGERREIFDIHLRGKPLDESVNPAALARLTADLTGAHIYRLVNEAALLAAGDERETIGMAEFEAVLARVTRG
jgi:cell division protease FtsH